MAQTLGVQMMQDSAQKSSAARQSANLAPRGGSMIPPKMQPAGTPNPRGGDPRSQSRIGVNPQFAAQHAQRNAAPSAGASAMYQQNQAMQQQNGSAQGFADIAAKNAALQQQSGAFQGAADTAMKNQAAQQMAQYQGTGMLSSQQQAGGGQMAQDQMAAKQAAMQRAMAK